MATPATVSSGNLEDTMENMCASNGDLVDLDQLGSQMTGLHPQTYRLLRHQEAEANGHTPPSSPTLPSSPPVLVVPVLANTPPPTVLVPVTGLSQQRGRYINAYNTNIKVLINVFLDDELEDNTLKGVHRHMLAHSVFVMVCTMPRNVMEALLYGDLPHRAYVERGLKTTLAKSYTEAEDDTPLLGISGNYLKSPTANELAEIVQDVRDYLTDEKPWRAKNIDGQFKPNLDVEESKTGIRKHLSATTGRNITTPNDARVKQVEDMCERLDLRPKAVRDAKRNNPLD